MLGLSGGKLRWSVNCFSGALIMTHPMTGSVTQRPGDKPIVRAQQGQGMHQIWLHLPFLYTCGMHCSDNERTYGWSE